LGQAIAAQKMVNPKETLDRISDQQTAPLQTPPTFTNILTTVKGDQLVGSSEFSSEAARPVPKAAVIASTTLDT
jgi:hypothetical protein